MNEWSVQLEGLLYDPLLGYSLRERGALGGRQEENCQAEGQAFMNPPDESPHLIT